MKNYRTVAASLFPAKRRRQEYSCHLKRKEVALRCYLSLAATRECLPHYIHGRSYLLGGRSRLPSTKSIHYQYSPPAKSYSACKRLCVTTVLYRALIRCHYRCPARYVYRQDSMSCRCSPQLQLPLRPPQPLHLAFD